MWVWCLFSLMRMEILLTVDGSIIEYVNLKKFYLTNIVNIITIVNQDIVNQMVEQEAGDYVTIRNKILLFGIIILINIHVIVIKNVNILVLFLPMPSAQNKNFVIDMLTSIIMLLIYLWVLTAI